MQAESARDKIVEEVEWKTEREFWFALEYRIGHEFAGMADRRLQYLGCDGFIPVQYLLSEDPPKIVGRAWICNGCKQEEWDFALLVPTPPASMDSLDRQTLIPARDMTCWIAVDRERKRIDIEPSAAVPDPE